MNEKDKYDPCALPLNPGTGTILENSSSNSSSSSSSSGGSGVIRYRSSSVPPSTTAAAGLIQDVQWATHKDSVLTTSISHAKDIYFNSIDLSSNPISALPTSRLSLPYGESAKIISWQTPMPNKIPRVLIGTSLGIIDALVIDSGKYCGFPPPFPLHIIIFV